MSENRFFSMGKRTFLLFSIATLLILFMSYFIGDIAQTHSTLFQLGRAGISTPTLAQLFLVSLVTNFIRTIFTTEKMVLRFSLHTRLLCLGCLSLVAITLLSAAFGWFPRNNMFFWIMTISSLVIAFYIPYRIVGKKKIQSQIYMDKLNKMKGENANGNN